jgi:hypothetical protein
MRKEPAEIGFFAKSESVLEMERKRLVDFLLLHIVSLQKTMGGDDIARTNVKAKLMADQGMADAVVPLSDDCLGFQITGEFDKEMEYNYEPSSITGIEGIKADFTGKTEIYSVGGQLMQTIDGTKAASIANLPSGIYIVKTNNKTTKIVKK